MWNRKDIVAMAVAGVATFSLSVALFLPGVANATDDAKVAKLLSPVLKVGECELTAGAVSNRPADAPATAAQPRTRTIPGALAVDPGDAPTFTISIKNPTDHDVQATFNAKLTVTAAIGGGRAMPRPQEQYSEPFNISMKAGETKEIQVDTKVKLTGLTYAQFLVEPTNPNDAAKDAGTANSIKKTSFAFPTGTTLLTLNVIAPAGQSGAATPVRASADQAARAEALADAGRKMVAPASAVPVASSAAQDARTQAVAKAGAGISVPALIIAPDMTKAMRPQAVANVVKDSVATR